MSTTKFSHKAVASKEIIREQRETEAVANLLKWLFSLFTHDSSLFFIISCISYASYIMLNYPVMYLLPER